MSGTKIYPPPKRDWTKGSQQIALFVRTEQGDVIEVVWDQAPDHIVKGVAMLIQNFTASAGKAGPKKAKAPKSR